MARHPRGFHRGRAGTPRSGEEQGLAPPRGAHRFPIWMRFPSLSPPFRLSASRGSSRPGAVLQAGLGEPDRTTTNRPRGSPGTGLFEGGSIRRGRIPIPGVFRLTTARNQASRSNSAGTGWAGWGIVTVASMSATMADPCSRCVARFFASTATSHSARVLSAVLELSRRDTGFGGVIVIRHGHRPIRLELEPEPPWSNPAQVTGTRADGIPGSCDHPWPVFSWRFSPVPAAPNNPG